MEQVEKDVSIFCPRKFPDGNVASILERVGYQCIVFVCVSKFRRRFPPVELEFDDADDTIYGVVYVSKWDASFLMGRHDATPVPLPSQQLADRDAASLMARTIECGACTPATQYIFWFVAGLVVKDTTLIIGALGGLIPESESSCRGIAWSVCGVCFLVLLAYLVSRPANNTIEAFAGLILLSAQVAVAVCSAARSSGAADAANIIALAATVFSCIQTLASFVVFKLFQRQDELLALLLSRWKRNINKHSSDEEGNQQQQKSIHLNVPSPPTMKNIGIHKLVAANKEERRQVLHHEALISFVTMICTQNKKRYERATIRER